MQIWALGSAAHPSQLQIRRSFQIKDYVWYFADTAANALHRAGCDGVEIHGAHGYLVGQFLGNRAPTTQIRTAGSAEKRIATGLR